MGSSFTPRSVNTRSARQNANPLSHMCAAERGLSSPQHHSNFFGFFKPPALIVGRALLRTGKSALRFLPATALILSAVPLIAATNPPFSIQQRDGVSWLIKPNGGPFFSFGVCVVTMGASREDFNPKNPGYTAHHHYADSNRWAEATSKRLQSWRFTTIGGWSDFRALQQHRASDLFFTPVLHVGSTAGVPWWDMWDTNIIARMHQIARDQILPLRDNPRLLGYYSDNEMGWWNAILFKMTLEHAPTSGQRQRLIQLLRETYQNNWTALLKDFESEGVNSFDELDQRGMLYLRPGSNGIRTYRRFLAMMAERYYALVREIIRAHDPRGLVLGDRYQSFFYPEVVRACAAHVDAVSGNLNANWNDGTFVRFYLDTLHGLTRKPIFVSEFYMSAQDNRSGNKNDRGVFPTVTTQKERTTGFQTTLRALTRVPYVVGADWFQYFDEPTHGRGDGENFNFGLVDIHNQPYESLTRSASAFDLAAMKRGPHRPRADASQGVPPAPRNPLSRFDSSTLALKHWDRERGFVRPVSEFPTADLYLCWDRKAVYVGLYAQDVVEDAFYRNKTVPEIDRAEWTVSIGGAKEPIRARVGAGAKPFVSNPAVRIANLSGVNLGTRNIAAIELPAKLFGKDRFKSGDALELDSTFFSHCRGYRVDWKGTFTLSK